MSLEAPTRKPAASREGERGAGVLLAIALNAIMIALVATSFVLLQDSKRSINRQLSYEGQTRNAAQAGLIDGLSWFRREVAQPVTTFNPERNMAANPPINETDDQSVGLVRDFKVSSLGNVWGRYELRLADIQDVSTSRGKTSSGAIWALESHGILYYRANSNVAYDQSPNRVLHETVARNEIQRMTLEPPANAAINVATGSNLTIGSNARVNGNGAIGAAYPTSTGTPTVTGTLNGSPAQSAANPYDGQVSDVFGVSLAELISMADLSTSNAGDLPATFNNQLVVFSGNLTFDSTSPMLGVGVLIVDGDLTISAASNSQFNGLVYVTGNFTQNAPSTINGAVVAQGNATVQGSGDFSDIYYDPAIITQLARELGQYRFSRTETLARN